MTYYEILGVSADAPQREVRDAFESLAKQKHPDQSDNPNATQEFIRIKEAYDVLGDPRQRERYDKLGHDEYMRRVSGQEVIDEEATQDYQSPEQTTAEGDNLGWEAYTRGSTEAEYIWEEDTERVTEKRPPAHTANRSTARRTVAYSLTTVPIAFFGFSVFWIWSDVWGGPVTIDLLKGTIASSLATVVLVILALSLVVIAEAILDSERRIYPFGE